MKDVRNRRQRSRTTPPLVVARLEATRRRVPEGVPSVAVNDQDNVTRPISQRSRLQNSIPSRAHECFELGAAVQTGN